MIKNFLQVSGSSSQIRFQAAFLKKLKIIMSYKYLYIIFIPVLVWYLIFAYIPMYGVIMAFQDFTMSKGYFGSPFVGLEHFSELLKDELLWRAFSNTVIIAAYRLCTIFPFAIILALLLNEVRHMKFRKTIQTIIYLPHFLSWVIVASIFITIFSPEKGLITAFCQLSNIETPDLLTNSGIFRTILISTDIWKEAGFSTVIYIAAMAGIDPQLYEAAIVDGAGRWSRVWHITLAGIRSTIVIMFILTIGQILNWGFDQVYNFYNPMVYDVGDILDTYIFRTAMGDNKFSYAAAAGMVRSILCIGLLVTSNWIVKKLGEESIY